MRSLYLVSFAGQSRTIRASTAYAAKVEFLRWLGVEVTSEIWFAVEVEEVTRLQAA